jgi:predicted membrane protein
MRIINHIIFLLALLGGIIFAAVNWNYMLTTTYVYLYFATLRLPLNLIVLMTCLAVLFLQWLVVQGAWIFRHRKLERAEKEVVQLKARLYDLTEGSWLDEIKTSIADTRTELREDIKWLAAQPYLNTPVQLAEGQRERRELPPG